MIYARITGTGSYLPEKILTNFDLEKIVDTTDQWIRDRTGIEKRHVALDGQTTVDLAERASRNAIEAAGLKPQDIDLIVVATTTPDRIFPSTACLLQSRLDIHGCAAFDIQAVCTGFVYALGIAEKFVKTGSAKKVLVVGAETLSRILNWSDRGTCVLFGDGAGAVVLEASEETGILSTHLHADGDYEGLLRVPYGISQGFDEMDEINTKIEMRGNEVFKMAVNTLGRIVDETLEANNMQKSDIDWLVPHQANIRIIDAMQKKMQLPSEKVIRTVAAHANTSAASIPLALATAVGDGRVQNGDLLAMEAIGGGLVWGAALVKFGRPS